MKFYNQTENIVRNGVTRTYRELQGTYRYPKGTQVSVRNTDDEMLIVCHSFEEPYQEKMCIPIPEGFKIADEFGNRYISIEDNTVIVQPMEELYGCAVLAVKK